MKKLLALVMATVTMSVFSMSAAALGTDIEVKDEWESVSAGDVNHDYTVDIRDLVRLKKHFSDKSVYIYENAAELDGETGIDSSDLAALRKLLLGIKL